jgi:kumamolisin
MPELPAGSSRIEGSHRAPVPGATEVGPADPSQRASISVRLRRRRGAPPFAGTLAAVTSGARAPMSRAEFEAAYGADPGDISAIEAFAREHGLEVSQTSIPRRTVVLSGTVGQLSQAFAVHLGRFEADGASYRGREGHVHVPAEIAPLVEGVFGLDDRQQARPVTRPAAASARNVRALTPPQVGKLYNFPAGHSAAGQCIGLLEFQGGYDPADITAWFEGLHLTSPALSDVSVDGAVNSPGHPMDLEVLLDIDVAGAIAQGADIAVYFAPWTEQGWVDGVTTAVHDATRDPSVLSISWGWPEFQDADTLSWTQAAMDAVDATFQEAAVLGITVLVASGDQGSQCQIRDGHAHVNFPASDPYVTACGGTQIGDVSGGSFTEVLWNDDHGASGGGVSDVFGVPAWQEHAAVPVSVNDHARHGRGVPDVAGNACSASGYFLVHDGVCTPTAIGGTSATAPLYAGLVALLNARLPGPAGYLNPILYSLAGSEVLRDITGHGTNGCPGTPGYPVGPGWDATTGLGRIDGEKLLGALQKRQNAVTSPPGSPP